MSGNLRENRQYGIYERVFKRILDFLCALIALIVLSPLLIALTAIGAIVMKGNPFFTQLRPGLIGRDGRERIFRMIKFRTMTNEKDNAGNLLPDEKRLNGYGRTVRRLSLDELPELFNILLGDMSFVGPRPQLVRDMVFMDETQRMRHTAKPGLTGLAQVMGRNAISWEEKFYWDLKYIEKITFLSDVIILFETVKVAFIRQEGITDGENATALDYGDALLKAGRISKEVYDDKQKEARRILESH